MSDLARLCWSHGIQPSFVDMHGVEREVPQETLEAIATAFDARASAAAPPADIQAVRGERHPAVCHVPAALETAHVWGIACQLPSLASGRNLGIGDFADLADFCRLAAAVGADFVGLNPLHALFWSCPDRVSPFFPSNRQMLNPRYLAVDWIEGFDGLSDTEARQAARLREPQLVDFRGVASLKDRVLRRLFRSYPWNDVDTEAFEAFRVDFGDALTAHAEFEAISEAMVADGGEAGWPQWPKPFQDRRSDTARAFVRDHAECVDYHLWLQWQASRQLGRVHEAARRAGMRIGLYLDFAVGVAPDGSATWSDPQASVPGLSIGAPPDYFSAEGQDWGLVPLSPLRLAATDGAALGASLRAVLRHAGAVRLDHVMSLTRLWLIPRGAPASAGAYVRYPLDRLLAVIAAESERAHALIVGEDLGVVPEGFRDLMAERQIHSYKVQLFERVEGGFRDPKEWPTGSLACVATHDMPTLAGWIRGGELALLRDLGRLSEQDWQAGWAQRRQDRDALMRLIGTANSIEDLSLRLHAKVASAPSRLFVLQIEDALGLGEQVNLPGTVDDYPNWRRRLPVGLDRVADHPGFRAHAAVLQRERPR